MERNVIKLKVDNKEKDLATYLKSQWSWKTLATIGIFSFVLVFIVNDLEIDFIKLGSKVTLTDGSHTFDGSIIRKGNFVNKNTQNISVFVSINDDADFLYDGMYLDAKISSIIINNVCKIPRSCVFDKKVFIVNTENKSNRFSRKPSFIEFLL